MRLVGKLLVASTLGFLATAVATTDLYDRNAGPHPPMDYRYYSFDYEGYLLRQVARSQAKFLEEHLDEAKEIIRSRESEPLAPDHF